MNQLKAWLRPNLLTEDKADFVATPVASGSMGIKEIIAEMVKDGMEIQPETAENIINRFNRKTAQLVASGYSVNTRLVLL